MTYSVFSGTLNRTQPPHHTRFTAFFLGLPGWAGARRRNLSLHFTVQGEITQADTLIIRLGATPSRVNGDPFTPAFLRQMSFLPQPSHFILAWDRHQIYWLAYPVAWLKEQHTVREKSHSTNVPVMRLRTLDKRSSVSLSCIFTDTNNHTVCKKFPTQTSLKLQIRHWWCYVIRCHLDSVMLTILRFCF